MSFIEFEKKDLINLKYSLKREVLRSNRKGGFANTSIVCCNTRKYHGLLIVPLEDLDGENHVLLSSIDETLVQEEMKFELGIHKYPGKYHPKGHQFIENFELDPYSAITYKIGGVSLLKEMLLVENEQRVLIRYTLKNAKKPAKLMLRPFLAFRNIHSLTYSNINVNTKFNKINNGIKIRMYNGYPSLKMQLSRKNNFIAVPDWYYNIEYIKEQNRGYDYKEDLFVPGYFEIDLKTDNSVVFSAGLEEISPGAIKKQFDNEQNKRISINSYENCLLNAANSFIVKNGKKTEIIAGFPWFGRWGRDTFIALPGLSLARDDAKTCKDVLNTMSTELKNGLFPNTGKKDHANYNSVDAPLWYIWSIQQYYHYTKDAKECWKLYGKKIKSIIKNYRKGTDYNIKMHDNYLIYAGEKGIALTWMDAIVNGKAVTPRTGFAVEINALWYNAVCFFLELSKEVRENKLYEKYKDYPEKIKKSFVENFWDDTKKYLADYFNYNEKDWSIRPNQIFAISLPYSPVEDYIKSFVIKTVKNELFTPKGLRTLSPKNKNFKGKYKGSQEVRDNAYHQGTVWPWLLGHFCEAWLNIYQEEGEEFVKKIFYSFEEDMKEHGIATISEVHDGTPPFRPKGAISQAWSVAELLRIRKLLKKLNR